MAKHGKNWLRFFYLFSKKQRVTGTVNPQVPGSNPGRGARQIKPCSNVRLFSRPNFVFGGVGIDFFGMQQELHSIWHRPQLLPFKFLLAGHAMRLLVRLP